MVKMRELDKIGKRLLPSLPGFTVDLGMWFMCPVGHTLRAIGFEDSSDAKEFYADVFIWPLFVPSEHCGLNIGWRLGGNWCTWNIDSPDVVDDLGAVLKREALPFLSPIHTPKDVVLAALSLKASGDPVVRQAIFFACCRAGDVEAARDALDQFINPLLDPPNHYWEQEIEQARALMSQLETSPADAQRQLDAWEAESARNLKLEKYR